MLVKLDDLCRLCKAYAAIEVSTMNGRMREGKNERISSVLRISGRNMAENGVKEFSWKIVQRHGDGSRNDRTQKGS